MAKYLAIIMAVTLATELWMLMVRGYVAVGGEIVVPMAVIAWLVRKENSDGKEEEHR